MASSKLRRVGDSRGGAGEVTSAVILPVRGDFGGGVENERDKDGRRAGDCAGLSVAPNALARRSPQEQELRGESHPTHLAAATIPDTGRILNTECGKLAHPSPSSTPPIPTPISTPLANLTLLGPPPPPRLWLRGGEGGGETAAASPQGKPSPPSPGDSSGASGEHGGTEGSTHGGGGGASDVVLCRRVRGAPGVRESDRGCGAIPGVVVVVLAAARRDECGGGVAGAGAGDEG